MGVRGEGHFLMRLSEEQRAELAQVLVEELGAPRALSLAQPLYRSSFPAFGGAARAILVGSDPPYVLPEPGEGGDRPAQLAACARANARLSRLARDWGFELFPEGAPRRARASEISDRGFEL